MTYDDLYKELSEGFARYSAAFKAETTTTQTAATKRVLATKKASPKPE